MSTRATSIFKYQNAAKPLSYIHDKYVAVQADKAPVNIVFVSKSHYIDCLIKKSGIENSLSNSTYTPMTLTKKDIYDSLYCVPLEFQPNMKNWIFCHSVEYISCTSVVTKKNPLHCWICQMLLETSF